MLLKLGPTSEAEGASRWQIQQSTGNRLPNHGMVRIHLEVSAHLTLEVCPGSHLADIEII